MQFEPTFLPNNWSRRNFSSLSSMALRRTLSHRFSHKTKIASPTSLNLALSHYPSLKPLTVPPDSTKPNLSSAQNWFFRRFLQKRALVQSALATEYRSLLLSDKLMEKLKGLNISQDRIRLDGLMTPPPPPMKKSEPLAGNGISVGDAKKLLRLAQLEMLKSALRRIPKSSISYSEFVEICVESTSRDQGLEFAKILDESGAVIVIKDSVFLRPEQVAKAIEGIIPLPIVQPNESRRRELETMEKKKGVIDRKAEIMVRRELWGGLGFLVFQTAGFVRLTFWDLSWDVMEPICFYLTSVYFMASYAFFLRTSQEPSFEGFFQSRFKAKQKRLMKDHKFDEERFNELRRACYPHSLDQAASEPPAATPFNNYRGPVTCAMHH